MGRSTKIACGCSGEMNVEKMGAIWVERAEYGRPYKLWSCDLCCCVECGSKAVILANEPFVHNSDQDFSSLLEAYTDNGLIIGSKKEGAMARNIDREQALEELNLALEKSNDSLTLENNDLKVQLAKAREHVEDLGSALTQSENEVLRLKGEEVPKKEAPAFKESFDLYVCEEDTISTEVDGFTVYATIKYDQDCKIDDDDCHSIDQSVTGCDDEQFKKLLEARKAWFNDEWFYCGVVLRVQKNGVVLSDGFVSLWGIEANYPGTDNTYLTAVANELLPEAIEDAKQTLKSLLDEVVDPAAKPYTVILLYPYYMVDDHRAPETFLAHVLASDTGQAIARAQQEAWKKQDSEDYASNLQDFLPLGVFVGHLDDIKG